MYQQFFEVVGSLRLIYFSLHFSHVTKLDWSYFQYIVPLKQTFFIQENLITFFHCIEDVQIYYFQDILERFHVVLRGIFHNI